MAETLTIRTAASTDVIKVVERGPQGPPGTGGGGGGSGSVTSVALASSDFTITGSPITSSGTITANIANNAVTLEKLQTISSQHLLGRHGTGSGGVQQVGLGAGLSVSGSNIRLATTGITAGTYTKLTIDETGRATSGDTATPNDIGAAPAVPIVETYTDLGFDRTLTAEEIPSIFVILTGGDVVEPEVNLDLPLSLPYSKTGAKLSVRHVIDGGGTSSVYLNVSAGTGLFSGIITPASTADFIWDGERWFYTSRQQLVVPNATAANFNTFITALGTTARNINLPNASGTLALTSQLVTDFSDSAFRVSDNTDSSKKVALECSGISASTTRTLTVANRSGTVVVSDTSAGSGSDVVNNIVSLTQAEYNAIGSPDAATLYLITDP